MMTPAVTRRSGFCDQHRPDTPFPADVQSGERAAHDQLPEVADEGAKAGAERVDRDRREQRALAPEPIAEPAEQYPARRPAQQQY
jgi:hypothetical protein